MSVQTLVENSLKHGIHPRIQGGSIQIEALLLDDRCRIIVDDTGIGLCDSGGGSGTGIANLRSRLDLIYGGDYSFEIIDKVYLSHSKETGVTVKLVIPLHPVFSPEHENV